MTTRHAGSGAALLVLLAITGLMVLIGVILMMMLMQPDIEHSPSEHGDLRMTFTPEAKSLTAQIPLKPGRSSQTNCRLETAV